MSSRRGAVRRAVGRPGLKLKEQRDILCTDSTYLKNNKICNKNYQNSI